MALAPLLSALTMALSLAFAAMVAERWRRRRKRHQALWAAALGLFAFASAIEVASFAGGWGVGAYKAYFVVTALMVGLMAAGTGHLVSARLGDMFAVLMFVAGSALALFVLFAPADAGALAAASGRGEVPTRVLGGLGVLHALIDIPAAALLIAAPLVSWRRTRAPHALLIAAGALVFTVAHTLPSGAQTGALSVGGAELFTAGSLLGLVLLFAGYRRSLGAPAPAAAEGAHG